MLHPGIYVRCLIMLLCPYFLFFTLFITIGSVSEVWGQTPLPSQTFNEPTPTEGDYFGYSVAIENDLILIGSVNDSSNGSKVGQAHLFDAYSGSLIQTLDDPTPHIGGGFGRAVAIQGGRALVGSFVGDATNGVHVGQAHLFDASTGNMLQTFNSPLQQVVGSDLFGTSVDIDGEYVLVGAPYTNVSRIQVGQAYLFNASNGNLLKTFRNPTPTSRDSYGFALALDGNRVLVGSHGNDLKGEDVGQAYLYDADTGGLLLTLDDPTPTRRGSFGYSVALDGDRMLISAVRDSTAGDQVGQVYLFDVNTGVLLHTFNDPSPSYLDSFGRSVSLDGNNVLIGEPADRSSGEVVGRAHLFDASTGTLVHTFIDPTPDSVDLFGHAVAVDGTGVLVGAYRNSSNGTDIGQAYLFIPEPTSAVWLMMAGARGLTRRKNM